MDHYIECFEGYARMFCILHSRKTEPAGEPDSADRAGEAPLAGDGAGQLTPDAPVSSAARQESQAA
jgi:hypothetical protein